jgi:phytoene dehydrogenase-like protein
MASLFFHGGRMSDTSLIIIGAGMAGLSAGCYARMNGYDVRIFEQHFLPGGLCTAWKRKGYTFDGAIRYLTGTGASAETARLWQELHLLQTRPVYYYEEFSRYEDETGNAFRLYTNINMLRDHMLSLSPADAGVIDEFCDALWAFTKVDLPVDLTPSDPQEGLELGQTFLPALGPLLRWNGVSLRQFANRFQSKLLREALPAFFQFTPPDFPMMMVLMTLASMHTRESGYPMGGSLALAEDLAKRFSDLGGKILYRSRVKRILIEEHRAVGVELEDGSLQRADVVISAGDGHSTLFDLLDGRYVDEKVQKNFSQLTVAHSILQVSLGVRRDFSAEPPMLSFPLRRPIYLGNLRFERLVLKHYCFDRSLCPAGRSVLTLWCEADYDYWKAIHVRPDQYQAAKGMAVEFILDALEDRYPGTRQAVQVVDVATPLTYERYTGNYRGSIHGWALTSRKLNMMMGSGMRKTLPGLADFFMIGQWVEPAGNVELSVASGRDVIKDLCKMEGREFVVD